MRKRGSHLSNRRGLLANDQIRRGASDNCLHAGLAGESGDRSNRRTPGEVTCEGRTVTIPRWIQISCHHTATDTHERPACRHIGDVVTNRVTRNGIDIHGAARDDILRPHCGPTAIGLSFYSQ